LGFDSKTCYAFDHPARFTVVKEARCTGHGVELLDLPDRPLRNNGTKMYAKTRVPGNAIENRFTLLIKSALHVTPATRTSQHGQQIL